MKVDARVNRLLTALKGANSHTQNNSSTQQRESTPQVRSATEDAVTFSPSFGNSVPASSPEKSSRLEGLKVRVQGGSYEPSATAVADSIIRELAVL